MVTTQTILIVISTILALVAPVVYIRSILKGGAKPHRTTRLVLLVITTLSATSLWANGSRIAFWLALAAVIGSTTIFTLSIKYGMGGWGKLDIGCLVIAFFGIVLWQLTNNPFLGLASSIVADFVGMVPTLVKTYRFPETEEWRFFGIEGVATILSLVAIGQLNFQEMLYPFYLMIINGLVTFLVLRPRLFGKK